MLYRTLRFFFRVIFILFGMKVEGVENIPEEQSLIIASNHLSFWDPILLAIAVNRIPVHFMGKEELFKNPIFAWFFRSLYAFPVKRGTSDKGAIRYAMKLLDNGEVLGIFPEGTRVKENEIAKPQTGVAMIAIKSKAQIVPVVCINTHRLLPWGFKIRIGKPLNMEEYKQEKINSSLLEKLSLEIMEEINLLFLEDK